MCTSKKYQTNWLVCFAFISLRDTGQFKISVGDKVFMLSVSVCVAELLLLSICFFFWYCLAAVTCIKSIFFSLIDLGTMENKYNTFSMNKNMEK